MTPLLNRKTTRGFCLSPDNMDQYLKSFNFELLEPNCAYSTTSVKRFRPNECFITNKIGCMGKYKHAKVDKIVLFCYHTMPQKSVNLTPSPSTPSFKNNL